MYESTGVIIAVDAGSVHVRARRQPNCSLCLQGKGCGGGLLPRMLGDAHSDLSVAYSGPPLTIGDRVIVGVAEAAVARALATVLLPPLAGLFAVGLLARAVAGDGAGALGSVVGLALGLCWSALRGRALAPQPCIVRRLPAAPGAQCT